jgi:hypothetical protein
MEGLGLPILIYIAVCERATRPAQAILERYSKVIRMRWSILRLRGYVVNNQGDGQEDELSHTI